VLGLGLSGGPGTPRGVPLALAPFIFRWGTATSSDVLRRSFRRAVCGAMRPPSTNRKLVQSDGAGASERCHLDRVEGQFVH
jgi:hypothetical protein